MSTAQAYTSYDEVDTSSRVTVAATTLTIALLDDNEDASVTEDFTASYFSGDFEHTLSFTTTAGSTGDVYVWGMADSVSQIGDLIAANTDLLALMWDATGPKLTLTERNSTVSTADSSSNLVAGTKYYIRIVRDEDTGTYGTLYCYIYTDSYYMDLVDTLVVTLTEKKDFRYLYAMSSIGNGSGDVAWAGTINDLTLDSYPYTFQNMRTRVRDLLNEATASFWSDALINRLLNDGERDIATKALCLQHIDSGSTTNGTRTVSTTGYRPIYVEYSNLGLPLILPNQTGRRSGTGTAPQKWFESGSNIGIEPLPDTTYPLNIYVADYPSSEMSANPDIPQIPAQFRPLIVLYAFGNAIKKEYRIQQASYILKMYENELTFTKSDIDFIPDGRSISTDKDVRMVEK